MKITLSLFVAILLVFGINTLVKSQEQELEPQEELVGEFKEDLVGVLSVYKLMDTTYNTWYDTSDLYILNKGVVNKIIDLNISFDVVIVLGTWCSDSQTQVPRFIKILYEVNYIYNDLLIVGLDEEKKVDNFNIEKYNIERVPTFVIYRDNIEIGRIVETPAKTLEEDLLDILLK